MQSTETLRERAANVLDRVMALPLADLEEEVARVHAVSARQKEDPPELPDSPSRQALRMLWHFRQNLEVSGAMDD
jgi:hypothetical protein